MTEITDARNNADRTWRWATNRLSRLRARHALSTFTAKERRLGLTNFQRPPDIGALSRAIKNESRWELVKVEAGLSPHDFFINFLARCRYPMADRIRPWSERAFTPEPDKLHDVFGHLAWLCTPQVATLYQHFGVAAASMQPSSPKMNSLLNVWIHTCEFGVVRKLSGIKAFGAGLLSSARELSIINNLPIVTFAPQAAANDSSTLHSRRTKLYATRSVNDLVTHTIRYLDRL
jgi:phenylalanine-4-hydroxylase